jgi:hypothetical protein
VNLMTILQTLANGMAPNLGPSLDFTEAIKDSPSFRHDIGEHEKYFGKVEKRLEEALRLVDIVIEHGQNYVASL